MRSLVSSHLGNFLALYEKRNMHTAAQKKAISQPALSKSLRVLEQELGTDLFIRTPHGLEPTDAGAALYGYARSIDQEARIASLDIARLAQGFEGGLRIGIGPALAASWFSSVLVNFGRAFPSIEVTVETGISSHLVDNLTRNLLDVVVTARPGKALPERFVSVPLFTSDMVVVCRREHPLRHGRRISIESLSRFSRIGFLEDREFDEHAEATLGRRAGAMRPIVQTASMSIMLGLLTETDCYAIVSELIVPKAEREGLIVLPLNRALWPIDVDLMCKASFIGSRPVRSIREGVLACSAASMERRRVPMRHLEKS
ncbi:MAG: LysR family transcriptional regulator [Rhizobiales bacterium]|nr:LysR family transcriptional regulator [Hyphomicrobiales bacterium]